MDDLHFFSNFFLPCSLIYTGRCIVSLYQAKNKKKKNKENIEKLFQCAISVFYLLRPNSITTTKQLIQIIFPMRMSAHRYSNRTNGNVRATLCVQLCVTSRSVCKNKVRIVLHCGEWCSCLLILFASWFWQCTTARHRLRWISRHIGVRYNLNFESNGGNGSSRSRCEWLGDTRHLHPIKWKSVLNLFSMIQISLNNFQYWKLGLMEYFKIKSTIVNHSRPLSSSNVTV